MKGEIINFFPRCSSFKLYSVGVAEAAWGWGKYNVLLPGEKHLNSASVRCIIIIINIFMLVVIIIIILNSASIRFCSVAPHLRRYYYFRFIIVYIPLLVAATITL